MITPEDPDDRLTPMLRVGMMIVVALAALAALLGGFAK